MPDFDPFWGPSDPGVGWVPPLRYLLRRARILALLDRLPRGRLLEIGCGSGALLLELEAKGFSCSGLETSAPARDLAQRLATKSGRGALDLQSRPCAAWRGAFDVVAAFDVLEHVADDRETLATWVSWLKPGGHLLISVPAHNSRWGPGDEWAGHYRRYDREQLIAVLAEQGCSIDHLECYGFPLANLTEWMGAHYYRKMLVRRGSHDRRLANALSGIERKPYIALHRLLRTLPGKGFIWAALLLQRAFLNTNLGSGYLAIATKPCAP